MREQQSSVDGLLRSIQSARVGRLFAELERVWRGYHARKREEPERCAICGSNQLVHEGPAEGVWCRGCGASDDDE